jgi:hypothetical protein
MRAYCWDSIPALRVLLICSLRQIYFTARIGTLLAVALALADTDITARYDCRVRAFHVCLYAHSLIGRDPKLETIFITVSDAPLILLIYPWV